MFFKRKRLGLIILAVASLAAASIFWLMTPPARIPQRDGQTAKTDRQAGPGLHNERPDNLKVVLEEPRPSAEYKLGAAIRVRGRVEVPDGMHIFEKEVYFQNQVVMRRGLATFSSKLLPLAGAAGHYSFETMLEDQQDLPKKPGTYEIKVTAPSLVEEEEEAAPAENNKARGARPSSPSAAVGYKVVRGPRQ
ncbi:MAG: hypothetical protein ACP5XB_05390 [Isosphaeraceae bacterium]